MHLLRLHVCARSSFEVCALIVPVMSVQIGNALQQEQTGITWLFLVLRGHETFVPIPSREIQRSSAIVDINTKLLHNYPVVDPYTGAVSIPKYQCSTFAQHGLQSDAQLYTYTRFGNPTNDALEKGICLLEGAQHALVFSSGMAAISTVLLLVNAGDHIILPNEVYGGAFQCAKYILSNLGIEATFVDMSSLEALEQAIRPNTRLIYIETPSNPLLKVTDIDKVVKLAKAHDILTACDNTFMTALYQHPLACGVDVVIESATKFINGHSDVVAGIVATNDSDLHNKMNLYQKNLGSILGTEDAWLVLRGMKTMALRMEKSVANASHIAEYMLESRYIDKVFYPGLSAHPMSDIQLKQAANGGAVLSFTLAQSLDTAVFLDLLKIPVLAVSLGGVESILSHPATMSHACLSPEERAEQGISDNLFRLSCGIEGADDLISDFDHALYEAAQR